MTRTSTQDLQAVVPDREHDEVDGDGHRRVVLRVVCAHALSVSH